MNTDHLQKVLTNKISRLEKLREQAALSGIDTRPEISIEIEDLERDINDLRKQLKAADPPQISNETEDLEQESLVIKTSSLMLEVEPAKLIVPLREWVPAKITFRNSSDDDIYHVGIRLKAPGAVKIDKKSLVLDGITSNDSQDIQFQLRIDRQPPDGWLPLEVWIRADSHPRQKIVLQLIGQEPVEPDPQSDPPPQSQFVPKIRELRLEVKKLTEAQFHELVDFESFRDLADEIDNPVLNPAGKTRLVMDFCRRRTKYQSLHLALKEILEEEYEFFDR